MPTVITGTDGINQVQAGAVESGDLASGAIDSGDLPAGSVIQVVSTTFSTQTSSNATSYASLGPSASITPSSASSKIFVLISGAGGVKATTGFAQCRCDWRILRDTSGGTAGIFEMDWNVFHGSSGEMFSFTDLVLSHLDSPATTSLCEYKLQAQVSSTDVSNNNAGVQICPDDTDMTVTLMEIAG